MQSIEIRKAIPADAAALQKIGIQTFTDAFASMNSPENMDMYLHSAFSLQQVTATLKHPTTLVYFAILKGEIIGYIKINLEKTPHPSKSNVAVEIERIYVLSSFQGKKTGQLLLDYAIETARQHQAAYVWLGVWEHNAGAIRFYSKNGFEVFGQHPFYLGLDKQNDLLMKLNLHAAV